MDDYMVSSMDNSMNYDNSNSGCDAMSDNNGIMGDGTGGTGVTPLKNSILGGLDTTTYTPLVSDLPLTPSPLHTRSMSESLIDNPALDDNTTPLNNILITLHIVDDNQVE